MLLISNVSEQSILCPSAQMSRGVLTSVKNPRRCMTPSFRRFAFSCLRSTAHFSSTTVKNSTTTHTNHDDWHQQRRLSRNNQPEIAFALSYTERVSIVPSIVAVASTIAPRSRLLSRHFHRLIAAAESADLGSSAAWSSTISCSELLESHARRFDVRNCAARLIYSWKCE